MNKVEMIRSIAGLSGTVPYFGSLSFELAGRSFEAEIPGLGKKNLKAEKKTLIFDGKESEYRAVKVGDELFLVGFDGRMMLFCAACRKTVFCDRALYASPVDDNILIGWETEMHFAAHVDCTAEFAENEVKLNGEAFPAEYAKMNDDLYAVRLQTEEGDLLLVLDLARFLIYGGINGHICIGGCIEVPEETK